MKKWITFLVLVGLINPLIANAQSVMKDTRGLSNETSLLTRQQQRMDVLEQGLKKFVE